MTMNKQDFLLEATLRLVATRQPEETVSNIVSMAMELTNEVFKEKETLKNKEGQYWTDEADAAPVEVIISWIERKGYGYNSGGYAFKLTKIFKENNIKTVGDLLRLGKFEFKKLKQVGKGSYTRIDDALEELYNIKGW